MNSEAVTNNDTSDPESAIGWVQNFVAEKTGDAARRNAIFLFCDYAPYITPFGQEDASLARRLRELAWKLKITKSTVLFVGLNFPELKTLEKEVTQIDLDLPQETEIEEAVRLQIDSLSESGLDIDSSENNYRQ